MYRAIGANSGGMLWLLTSLMSPLKSTSQKTILPTGAKPVPPTSKADIDKALQVLESNKGRWVTQSCASRAKLLRASIKATIEISDAAIDETVAVKGGYGTGKGEEAAIWMVITQALRLLADAMDAEGQPKPHKIYSRPDGQLVADVFPLGLEGILYGGFSGEIWIQPGKEATQGAIYRQKQKGFKSEGAVSLVLGAGNQIGVPAEDILYKLFHEDEVVIVKMNPVNEFAGKYLEAAFKPFVDEGYVKFVYGGAEEGKLLCNSPVVKSIHLTGSAATYEAIMWGTGSRKDPPTQTREVSAELGCVTPYIVAPGKWTESDLKYHAGTVASALTHNASHNCLAAEVLVLDRDWPQREAFLDALRDVLNECPQRVAYYPGSADKFNKFKKAFSGVEELGCHPTQNDNYKTHPWMLKTGLTPEEANTEQENWVGVLQQVDIPAGGNAAAFLPKAVDYANNKCWGTLSCAVIVDAANLKSNAKAVDTAIANLRYGAITINMPSIVAFAMGHGPWGAYPGATPQDIQSGNCFVHNGLLFDHVQKGVFQAPWRMPITPFWSPSHKNAYNMLRSVTHFVANPNFGDLNKAAVAALWG